MVAAIPGLMHEARILIKAGETLTQEPHLPQYEYAIFEPGIAWDYINSSSSGSELPAAAHIWRRIVIAGLPGGRRSVFLQSVMGEGGSSHSGVVPALPLVENAYFQVVVVHRPTSGSWPGFSLSAGRAKKAVFPLSHRLSLCSGGSGLLRSRGIMGISASLGCLRGK